MKKFEILNDRWIKQLDFGVNPDSFSFAAIKLSDVSCISGNIYDTNDYRIWISTSGGHLLIVYKSSEGIQYNEDLTFLEKLLIK